MHTIPGLQFYCMTPYDAAFKGVHILFDNENVQNTLGEYLAANGKTQLHIAETEKYAHVTFFFNGDVYKRQTTLAPIIGSLAASVTRPVS